MNDKEMILDVDKWPCWPWLPMKKKGEIPGIVEKTAGLLCCSEDHLQGKMVIFHANLYNMPPNMEDVPRTEYPNVDAMIADGWVVD